MLVLAVVWWAWNYTTWVTNELDPDSIVVRLLLLGLMFASLLMAVAIPEAFGDARRCCSRRRTSRSRSAGTCSSRSRSASPGTVERERAARILIWLSAAGVFWLAGGATDGTTRDVLWLIALAIDYGAPSVVYWVPGRPHADERDVGRRDVALRRALPALHHHRPRRVDRDHRRDDRRPRAEHGARRRRSRSRSSRRRRCGGCTSTTSRRSRSGASRRRRTGRCSRATATRTSTSCSSRDHRRRGRRRARDRAPDRRAADGGGGRGRGRPGGVPARPRRCSGS